MNKRLLFIAYFYPPLGGPGVQRPLKTIKYLKDFGWEIDVLTVADIQFHSYDFELLQESRADNIYRTKSFDLMSLTKGKRKRDEVSIKNSPNSIYFSTPEKIKKIIRGMFPIDDKIGWFPFAYKKALHLLKNRQYSAIVATIGPYTSGVLAYCLHKKTNVPYFIDYRDHWTLHSYPQYRLKILNYHAKCLEKKILRHSKGVFVVSSLMKKKMIDEFGEYLLKKTEVVYNGFDDEDFLGTVRTHLCCPKKQTRHKITTLTQRSKCGSRLQFIRYIGNFYGNRNVQHFINVLNEMNQKNEIPANVRFEFVGNYFTETQRLLKSENLSSFIQIIPQVSHKEAVRLMQTADLLLLFIPSSDGEDFMTGKLLEYIRACVPILAMIPENGEAAKILRDSGHNLICKMEDEVTIRSILNDFLLKSEKIKHHDFSCDEQYSRKNQTQKFNMSLEKVFDAR